MRHILLILLVALATACSDHPSTSTADKPTYPPTTGRIRVIEGDLPPDTDYFVLDTLRVETGWYGALDDAKRIMADRARKIGADAVINAKTWHAPSGLSWASPHGSGLAVKLRKPESVDLEQLPGGWF